MAGYIGPDPSKMRDTQNRVSYVAAADQTTFAAIYTPGYIDFYQNGVKLQEGIDFTANTGTTAVLTTPAFLGDTIEIVCISSSSPWNFYTKAQVDIRADNFYGVAAGSGDAMTTSLTPTPTALFDGMEIKIRVPAVNSITAPSLTIMGLGVSKTIFTAGGQALSVGAYAAGQEITLRYNITADRFELTAGALVYGSTQAVADDSTKVATTGWVRSAMSNIATAAGFAYLFASNGYIKFPSWLGGLVIQWGLYGITNAGSTYAYPIAFPSAAYVVFASSSNNNGVFISAWGSSNTHFVGLNYSGATAFSTTILAIGY